MLKKLLPLLSLIFILVATPAIASQNKSLSQNSQESCDEEAEWKNHGKYVSCVAKLHEGGPVTSAAARSDIGKKHQDDDNTPSPTPSATPSVSPSPTVEPSPTPTPTVTPTPSPTPEAGTEVTLNSTVIQSLIDKLKDLISELENLIS